MPDSKGWSIFCIFINEEAKKVNLKFYSLFLNEKHSFLHLCYFLMFIVYPHPSDLPLKYETILGEIIPKPVIKSGEGVTEAWLGGVNTNFWSGTLT